jgi:2,5-diamino-6-(ribosylamino)-4(3H)-pyrimidinone 5'-phosphate reductase
MTADGKIDTAARRGAIVSSTSDKARVDRLRAASDAVMVGGLTLLGEDPRLTVKSAALRAERRQRGLDENPAKVGVVSVADLPLEGRFLNAGPARVIVLTTQRTPSAQLVRLRERAEVFVIGERRVDLVAALETLKTLGVKRLLVEGGGTLNAALLRARLVDELLIYIAPLVFAGADAPTLADGIGLERQEAVPLHLETVKRTDDGGIIARYTLSACLAHDR